jgi:hypothetical protein
MWLIGTLTALPVAVPEVEARPSDREIVSARNRTYAVAFADVSNFQEGHGCQRNMTPAIPLFHNEINTLRDFWDGVNIAGDFAGYLSRCNITSG